jgi:hypothetical protein
MSNNPENSMSNNQEPTDERFDPYIEKFREKNVEDHSFTDVKREYEIYPNPFAPDERDEAAQHSPESNPNSRYQRVTAYLGSLMERVGLRGDPEEYGQDQPGDEEYDQSADDMNRVIDIENRARQGEELTAEDVYFYQYPEVDADFDRTLENSDHTQLARNLLKSGPDGQNILARNLDKFDDGVVDHFQLARKLMDNGMDFALAENLDKFQYGAVDHTEFARGLMNQGVHGMKILARNLEKFDDGAINHAELAQGMMDTSTVSKIFLARNLDKFRLDAGYHSELARDLMNNDLEALLIQYLDKFREVPADVRDRLPRGVSNHF